MQILNFALIVFVLVASFGSFLFIQRKKGKKTGSWMVTMHGIGGLAGITVLLIGIIIETHNDMMLIALVMFGALISGAFLMFRKLLKGRPRPHFLIAGHAAFAVTSIGVLLYSLVLTHYA